MFNSKNINTPNTPADDQTVKPGGPPDVTNTPPVDPPPAPPAPPEVKLGPDLNKLQDQATGKQDETPDDAELSDYTFYVSISREVTVIASDLPSALQKVRFEEIGKYLDTNNTTLLRSKTK